MANYVPEQELELQRGKLLKLAGDLRGERIICEKGSLWVTQTGDPEDHVLKAGQEFIVTNPGLVLIESLCDGQAHIVPPTPVVVYQN